LSTFKTLFEVIESACDFVCEGVTLLTENDVLVICACEIAGAAEALPEQHWRDMFDVGCASHKSFDGLISVSGTS
jgi:hypothetical protein